ncbi:MAG: hypothetical protein Alpg2KO_13000 [Alphaproteobacteria bacterium]
MSIIPARYRQKRAASVLSYGLVLGLIGVIALATLDQVGSQTTTLFERVATSTGEAAGLGSGDAAEADQPGPDWVTGADLGTVAEGEVFGPVTISATGSGTVTYTVLTPPVDAAGLSFDAGAGSFSGTAAQVSQETVVEFQIRATDDEGSVDRTFQITVTDISAPTDGLIAAFLFDGSLGGATAFDDAPTYVPGIVGQAIRFDGVDDNTSASDNNFATGDGSSGPWGSTGTYDYRGDYLNLGNGSSYDFETFSMSFWVNLPLSNTAEFMSKRPNCGTGTQFGLRYGVFGGQTSIKIELDNLSRSPSNVSPDPRLPISANTWHHVAFSRTDPGSGNATVDGWVDGVQVVTGQQVVGGVIENPTALIMGLSPCAPATGYGSIGMTVGDFDQLRIYDRALIQDDINRLYNSGNGS